jgi:nitroreductase
MYVRIVKHQSKNLMVLTELKKTAETNYPINDLIANRWSPRAFKAEAIPKEQIFSLLEAARWAPSSMNEQPWRFIYAQKGETAYDQMVDSLLPGNQSWAKEAPLLIATVIKTTFEGSKRVNHSAAHDMGLAVGNLSLQATAYGIGIHQMGGFDRARFNDHFDLSEDYQAITILAMGYYGDPETLDEPLKERELANRKRKSLEEIAFHGALHH